MDAAVAALFGAGLGAVIGAVGTLSTTWLQQRQQNRRDRLKTAADLGLVDFNNRLRLVEKSGGTIAPLSSYVWYHNQVLEALAEGTFDVETIAKIDEQQIALLRAIKHQSDKRQSAHASTNPT